MFEKLKKVTIIGVGGGAAFYVAKVLSRLDISIVGYDQKENARTNELSSAGVSVIYANPESWEFADSDLVVYTTALPKQMQTELFEKNVGREVIDSGTYYEKIVEYYSTSKSITSKERDAIRLSNIAPLFDIDLSNVTLIGVTGSKGKTTTSQMIYDTLRNLGAKVSLINTIGGRILDEKVETGLHTSTPSAQELAVLFTKMIEKGSKIIVVEASSHAIATGRISGLKFDYAIITNLQPEHLDFHKTIEHVIQTKKQLVTKYLKPNGAALVNIDDDNIREKVLPELSAFAERIYTISLSGKTSAGVNSYLAEDVSENESSIEFSLKNVATSEAESFVVPFAGKFNALNIFPSVIIARELGYSGIKDAIAKLHEVSGRNQVLQTTPFKVVLDFAHTPESLEEILKTYKTQPATKRVIVVFGAAGQRDTMKRPRMGVAAAKYADVTILTAEDPRTESLTEINNQIESGWKEYVETNDLVGKRTLLRFENMELEEKCRTEAINHALTIAEPGDVVICAGKGPEKSMCIGFVEKPWDEKATVEAFLNRS